MVVSKPLSFGEACYTALANWNSLNNCRKPPVTTSARITSNNKYISRVAPSKDLFDRAVFVPGDWFSNLSVWDVNGASYLLKPSLPPGEWAPAVRILRMVLPPGKLCFLFLVGKDVSCSKDVFQAGMSHHRKQFDFMQSICRCPVTDLWVVATEGFMEISGLVFTAQKSLTERERGGLVVFFPRPRHYPSREPHGRVPEDLITQCVVHRPVPSPGAR